MKLSEACRLGPLVVPTIHGPIFKRDWTGGVCGACRIGSVAVAAGYRPKRCVGFTPMAASATDSREVYQFFRQQWPWVDRVPNEEGNVLYLFGVVSYVAYCHEVARMTADEIADNIEKLEAKYDTATIDVAPHVAGDATQLMEVK